MTHYGLPDLASPNQPRYLRAYWLGGLAVLLGTIALVLRRIARGRTSGLSQKSL